MTTQEISRDDWANFFDVFSKQHEGWLATLEVFGSDLGAQTEGLELPFEGISFNPHNGEPESLVIHLGRSSDDHISHTITRPQHVWLKHTPDGAHDSLEFEGEDQKTLLRFRSPMRPEFVDGLV
jgi:Family of unknown function (DUF5335)